MRVPFSIRRFQNFEASAVNQSCTSRLRAVSSRRRVFSRMGRAMGLLRGVSLSLVLCLVWTFAIAPIALAAQPSDSDRPHVVTPMTMVELARRAALAQQALAKRHAGRGKGKRGSFMPSLADMIRRDALRQRAVHHPLRAPSALKPVTLLDEVGQLPVTIPAPRLAAWAKELKAKPSPQRAATLRLWLGEWQLAQNEQPHLARWQFQQAERLVPKSNSVHGAAAYDSAMSLSYEGAYAEANEAFKPLLDVRTAMPGYDRHNCALWLRHCAACAGYHAEHSRLGVPEPPRLDPLCGVAALAACLRTQKLPWDKKTLLKGCRVTGEGSTLDDIVKAGPKLGVTVRTLTATDEGLMSLPKPLVAFVEHDHFVAVVRADKAGVSYLCSDCGAWPGGLVNLTWSQWHALSPGNYAAATRPGSSWDRRLLAAQEQGPSAPPEQVAMVGNPKVLRPHLPNVSLIRGVSVKLVATRFLRCATNNRYTIQCIPCTTFCFMDSLGISPYTGVASDPLSSGPSENDPVDVATGEEEYTPTDLTVYNPHGPSVTWGRIYDSLRSLAEATPSGMQYSYQYSDYGQGWSNTYNVSILNDNSANGLKYLMMPNGTRIAFTPSTTNPPTAANPVVACTVQPGYPMLMEWDYDPNNSGGLFKATFADRTRWIIGGGSYMYSNLHLLHIIDRNGNAIDFNYGSSGSSLLSTITDASTGTALLKISRNGNGNIIAISDAYGRSVYYHVGGMLDWVSQIVPTCAANPAARYAYGYQNMPNGEGYPISVLHSISVPSPVGDGSASTATINYDNTTGYVTGLTDGNGNQRTYSAVDGTHTAVTVTDPKGNTASEFVVGFDNNMSQTSKTSGTGAALAAYVYSDPNYPYRPSAVLDGRASQAFNHTNPVISPGGSLNVSPNTYSNSGPSAGNTWDIINSSGTVVSSFSNPNGWTAAYVSGGGNNGNGSFTLTAPANLNPAGGYSIANGYTLRSSMTEDGSALFDVINLTAGSGMTTYTWDQYGNQTSQTSPTGIVTTNTYDYSQFALGELVSSQVAGKGPTTYQYFEPSGLLKSRTAPAPGAVGGGGATVTTSLTYSALGDILTITRPGNDTVAALTDTLNYTTDGSFNQTAAMGQPLTITDNAGKITHLRYDARGNKVTVQDAAGNETDTAYDIANQVTSVTFPATGQTGTGHASVTTTYLYPHGPKLAATIFDESGQLYRQSTFSYGNEGEMLSQSGSCQSMVKTYDALYRMAATKEGSGSVTRYSYGTDGYVSSVTSPGGDTYKYPVHDANGYPLQRVDPRGLVTNFAYNDPSGQLTDIQYPNSPALNVHKTYDNYGRLLSISDGTGVMTYGSGAQPGYDDLNEVVSVQIAYNNLPAQTISYTYNPDGTRHGMNTPAGPFTYAYDNRGYLTQLTNPFGETTAWAFANNGWAQSQTSNNLFVASFAYNARGQCTEILNQKDDLSNTVLSDFKNIQYDAAGSMSSITSSVPTMPSYGGTVAYAHDGKNELTTEQSSAAGGYSNSFAYDASGNPTTFRSVACGTYNGNNQTTAASTTYDSNGNPTTYNGTAASFDPENRLTQFGTTFKASYRSDNLRAWKESAAGRTYFLYDGPHPICELNTSGTVTAVNTFSATGLCSRHDSTGSIFYTSDLHGNVVQRLDANGNVLTSQTFDAFGKRLSSDSNTDPFCGFGGIYGYYTDYETGLELLANRYYDPAIGRFLTRDPSGLAGGVNLYEYVGNGPTVHADPLGLGWWPDDPTNGILQFIGLCAGNLLGQWGANQLTACSGIAACIGEAVSVMVGEIVKEFASGLKLASPLLIALVPAIQGCVGGGIGNGIEQIIDSICDQCNNPQPFDLCALANFFIQLYIHEIFGCVIGVLDEYTRLLCGPEIEFASDFCRFVVDGLFGSLEGYFGNDFNGAKFPGCP